jgi:hypothetical protein
MATQTFLDMFSGPVLTELAQTMEVKRGLLKPLPAGFYKPSANKVGIDQVKYKRFQGSRRVSPVIHHQSTSPTVEVPGSEWVYGTALGTKENFVVDYPMIQALTSGVPYITQNAMNEFKKRLEDFFVATENFRTTAIHMMALTGYIYIKRPTTGFAAGLMAEGGQLLATSSGAQETISVGSGQTPSSFSTGSSYTNTSIAVGDWSSASTDIPGSLRALRQGYIKTSNYNPTTIVYGANIPSYMADNTAMQSFMSRNQIVGKQFMESNEIPNGLLDYNWVPGYNAYWKDYTGTLNTILDPDTFVVFPEIDDNWYELVEVGTMIPTGIGSMVSPDVEGFLRSLTPAFGKFSYATIQSMDPISLKAIAGDYFYPALKTNLLQWIVKCK